MSWKKLNLNDDPGLSSNAAAVGAEEDLQLAWKRPRLSASPAAVTTTSGSSWKKLSVSSVSCSIRPGSKGGAPHLVWHSVSIDEPTLSLIRGEGSVAPTEFKKAALDPNRVAKLAAQSCGCKGSCFSLFRPPQIMAICQLWHALSDESQSHFLNAQWEGSWEADDEDDAELAHRTNWCFAGQRVCVAGLCGLLGIGKKSLMKKLQGIVDMRRRLSNSSTMPKASLQANLVDMFLFGTISSKC